MKKQTLFDQIANMCSVHADLIAAKVNPDQALRIAFGDDIAEKSITIVKQIEDKVKEVKDGGNI